MNKLFYFSLLVIIICLSLVACSTESIEKVNIYEMKGFSKVNDKSLIEVTDSEEISIIKEAVMGAEKVSGVVDVVEPKYKFEIGEEAYFLWLGEESGSVMNEKDTHTIYTLSDKSVKKVNELLAKKSDS